ncbi:MAG TPA: hypothetical protein VG838_18525 [Opitutaceae bacterium]|nr:hypothetical protein [Opitutaceae bacterium]
MTFPREHTDVAGRTYSRLLIVVVVGLACNLLSALFPTLVLQAGRHPNVFAITGHSPAPNSAQIFFDFGYGIFPDEQSSRGVGPETAELKFDLPAGVLYGLRFDPTANDQVSFWTGAELRDEDGQVLHRFAPSDFIPRQQIGSVQVVGDSVIIAPTKGANDAITELRLDRPVKLPDASAAGRKLQSVNFLAQRAGALVLALAGLAIARLVFRRRRLDAAEKERAPARWLELLVLGFAALSITFFRRPSIFIAPQMYVEDAVVFFSGQWAAGWKAVFLPYAGYLHLAPRLIAGAASWFPAAWAPRFYGTCALACVVAAVWKTASPRVGLPFAYACALAVVLVPNMDEITAFAVNVHWWGAVILVLIALSAPARTGGELARDLFAVMLFGLSGPWALLFSPLFAWRAWRARTAGSIATLVLAVAAGLVQYHFSIPYPPLPPGESYWHAHLLPALAGVGYRTGGQLIGHLPLVSRSQFPPWEFAALGGWLLLLVLLPVSPRHRSFRWPLVGVAVVVVAATVMRCRGWEYMLFSPAICQRYLFLPLLITLWLLLLALDNPAGRRCLAIALLAVIAIRNVDYVRMPPVVDFHWEKSAAQLDRGEAVSVPIYPAGWVMKLEPRLAAH